jgi:hypothetical protein
MNDFDNSEAIRNYLYAKQAYHAERHDRWVRFVRLTYNFGIMASLLAMAIILVLPGPSVKISGLRVTAIIISQLPW